MAETLSNRRSKKSIVKELQAFLGKPLEPIFQQLKETFFYVRYIEVPELVVKEYSCSSTMEIEPRTSPEECQDIIIPEGVIFMFCVFFILRFLF